EGERGIGIGIAGGQIDDEPGAAVLAQFGEPALDAAHDRSPRRPPSPPPGAERVGVRWGIPERVPTPTSPSHCCAMGPSLSPLKGGEGIAALPVSPEISAS